jgi:hypothetical protein
VYVKDRRQVPRFEKWIERDLLKMNTLDVDRVTLKDYSIVTTETLAGLRKSSTNALKLKCLEFRSKQMGTQWLVQFRNGEKKLTAAAD